MAFDPRVIFDPGSNRFFLVAAGNILNNPNCTPGTCVSHFLLAVSKTSNPTTLGSGDWYFYAFDATLDGATPTTNWVDFPGLGVDENAVVLTGGMWSFSGSPPFGSSPQYAKIRILDKSKLIRGEPLTWTDFFGMTNPLTGSHAWNLQPALHFGSPGTFFLLEPLAFTSYPASCSFVVWGIENLLLSPTLSAHAALSAARMITSTRIS